MVPAGTASRLVLVWGECRVSRYGENDTIAALATPPGRGGIGIVRLSGPGARGIGKDLGLGLLDRVMMYGWIRDRETGEPVDEVLSVWMEAPRTYTREDVLEIHAHGGPACLDRILEMCLAAGARVAEPGEFTRRAFLNGRIDLAQAESVADLVRARTDGSRKVAVAQLEGALSREIVRLEEGILSALSQIEGSLDFPEHDEVEAEAVGHVRRELEGVRTGLRGLIGQWRQGRIMREGLAVVIAGRPNVGKSSLLNALLRQDRALVSTVPGTTRDSIEESLDLDGIPVTLVDTAGIAEASDEVERMGVERSRRWIRRADVALWVLDAGTGLNSEDVEVVKSLEGLPGAVLWNKSDLHPGRAGTESLPVDWQQLEISALKEWGLEDVRSVLLGFARQGPEGETPLVSSARHREVLSRALREVEEVLGAGDGVPPEIVAVDLKEALEALGEITGRAADRALLDRIFETFCVGK